MELPDTLAHRRHWDGKYARGNTHEEYRPDADLIRLSGYFPPTGLALDLACGTGRNSFFMAGRGFDVVCMDFSEQGFDYFRHQQANHPSAARVHPVLADLRRIPLPGNTFDVIVVIRYLDRGAFSIWIEALKPGGLLLFKAFNLNHLKRKPGFNPDYLLNPGELLKLCKDQKIKFTNDSPNITEFESLVLLEKYRADST